MIAIKRNGHGQTYCSGCIAKPKTQPLHWDSMTYDLKYSADGSEIGTYCYSCLSEIKNKFRIEVQIDGKD